MRGKEIITKLIIPGAIAMIICLIVHPMCMNGEILDWISVWDSHNFGSLFT